jgi:hypothetical protein
VEARLLFSSRVIRALQLHIFEEGTLDVGAVVSGTVFGEAVSINDRIELVLLPSRNKCYSGRHDCNNDLSQAEYLYLFKCIASLIT